VGEKLNDEASAGAQQSGSGATSGAGAGTNAAPGTGTGTAGTPPPAGAQGGGGSQADQSGPRQPPTASWENPDGSRVDWQANPDGTTTRRTEWQDPNTGRTYDATDTGPSGSDFASSTERHPDGTTTDTYRQESGRGQQNTYDAEGNLLSSEVRRADGTSERVDYDPNEDR
jgi:YD repeat-containing protein